MIRIAIVTVALFTAITASAQRPLFDPDDFLDPRETGGRPVLISRIVVGAASNMNGDGFRPLGDDLRYVHLANSFSWKSVQFDYKRSEMRAEDGEAAQWEREFQLEGQFVSFRQTRNATPKSKDTLNAAWYWPVPGGGGVPIMLRSRVTFSTQKIETFVEGGPIPDTQTSNRERTFALDTDTWFRIAGHDIFGSLAYSQTKTSGPPTNPNTVQSEARSNPDVRILTYTNRFPAFSDDRAKIVVRPTLTIGGISDRGGRSLNLVNPAIEIFRPFVSSGANLHVIWSPQWVATGNDWKMTHQVAVLVDRALFVKVF